MVRHQTQVRQEERPLEGDESRPLPKYFVDPNQAGVQGLALALFIAGRRCYACQQADDVRPTASSDPKPYMDRIAKHCGETSDYLLPDTPLKEAFFRVLLMERNRSMDAEEISRVLAEKWALTPYPRDISPLVIQRLLDHSRAYCVSRVPGSETEPVS